MIKHIIFLLALLTISIGNSQNKELLYDFTDLPQSQLLNPGSDVFYESHLGIPFFSHIHFNYGLQGVTPYNILANDDGVDITSRLKAVANSISNNDHLIINQQLELINIGWSARRFPNTYFTAGIYEEFDFIGYAPKNLVQLALYGNQYSVNQELGFYDITAKADLMNVFHFGINKKVNDRTTIGGRIKLYSSILNFETRNNSGSLKTRETPNGNNIYYHDVSNIDVTIKTAGYASIRDGGTSVETITNTAGKAFFGGNMGFGIDLGFTHEFTDQWIITGSILDLGAIYYNKDTEIYNAKLDYKFEGIELPPQTGDKATNILAEVQSNISLDTLNYKYTSYRPAKINGSIKYTFTELDYSNCDCRVEPGKRRYIDAIGLQIFTQFRPRKNLYAASLFYHRRISNTVRGKITYTVDDYSHENVGLIISTHFKKFNLYLAMNNLFDYRNLAKSHGVSTQIGINLISLDHK